MPTPALPRPGDVVIVGDQASVQFAGARQLTFRITRIDKKPTHEGWAWLYGYSLAANGDAVEKREIFVRVAGLIRAAKKPSRPATKGAAHGQQSTTHASGEAPSARRGQGVRRDER